MLLNWANIFAIAVASQLGLSCAKSYIIQVRDAESGAPVPSLSTLVLGYSKDGRDGSITLSSEKLELFVPDLSDPAIITSATAYGVEATCPIEMIDWNAGEQDTSTGIFILRATAKCLHHSPCTWLRGYSAATGTPIDTPTGTPAGTPTGTPIPPRRSIPRATEMKSRQSLTSSMEDAAASSLGQ